MGVEIERHRQFSLYYLFLFLILPVDNLYVIELWITRYEIWVNSGIIHKCIKTPL